MVKRFTSLEEVDTERVLFVNGLTNEFAGWRRDSTIVGSGGSAPCKNGPRAIGKCRGVWNTQIHAAAADAQTAAVFSWPPGNARQAKGLAFRGPRRVFSRIIDRRFRTAGGGK
jgi:hypothetical protein